MKEFKVKLSDKEYVVIQDDDGKFIFPKQIEKDFVLNGTSLKPANEPICLARKPLEGTVAENVLKWGTGGINIDGSRIGTEIVTTHSRGVNGAYPKRPGEKTVEESGRKKDQRDGLEIDSERTGRFPANIILDETAAKALDEQSGFLHASGNVNKGLSKKSGMFGIGDKGFSQTTDYKDGGGGASRFFYVAKASTSERNKGLENRVSQKVNDGRDTPIDNPFQRGESLRKNTHPTVKPISLIKYLIKLVTPKGGICLDLYNGSGTAGCAIAQLNKEDGSNDFSYLGIDREQEYIEISKSRIEYYLGEVVKSKEEVAPKVEESANVEPKSIEDLFE